MQLPASARYDRSVRIAHEFLLNENITSFPIDPFIIINKHKWGLITYTELARKYRVNISQIIISCESEDGYITFDGSGYNIAYNDTVRSDGRIRFTLMHEIGHILLTHLIDFKKTLMSRNSLSEEEYKILENEANVFARNFLSPVLVVKGLKLKSEADIIYYFKISRAAANTRLNCIDLDLRYTTASITIDQISQFRSFVYSIMHSNYCSCCGYFFVRKAAKYCPICGHSGLLKRGKRKMKYIGYDLDENGRAHICPKCENEETSYGANCIICGTDLVNKCARTNITYDNGHNGYSQSCDTIAPGNARYCYNCGNETTFFQSEVLKPWDEEKQQLEVAAALDDDDTIPF